MLQELKEYWKPERPQTKQEECVPLAANFVDTSWFEEAAQQVRVELELLSMPKGCQHCEEPCMSFTDQEEEALRIALIGMTSGWSRYSPSVGYDQPDEPSLNSNVQSADRLDERSLRQKQS